MAAPPAKPSPSNQAVQRSSSPAPANDDAVGKGPPPKPSSPVKAAAAVTLTTTVVAPVASSSAPTVHPQTAARVEPPTYDSTECSEDYLLAKELLAAGTFEEALGVIEQAIETTKSVLLSMKATVTATAGPAAPKDGDDDDVDLHESIAPLHYLYGTTLLYSLEEARDDGTGDGATNMTVLPAGVAEPAASGDDDQAPYGSDEEEAEGDAAAPPSNPWAHLPSRSEGMAEAASAEAAEPQDDGRGNNDGGGGGDDDAEDIQIAWENLEAARTIVGKMLLRPDMVEARVAKLQLDLAQILLREGDLQRLNGRYASAIQDYTSCLELRQSLLDPWDRKIADTQFNLGLTHMSNSSELLKELAGGNNTNEGGEDAAPPPTPNAEAVAKVHSKMGIEMQVQCARTLCGIIARLCGVEPELLVEQTPGYLGGAPPTPPSKPAAGFKTTGLDDEDGAALTAVASQTVNVWRKKVASLVGAAQIPGDTASAEQVFDIQQVLDEIQETIDEAERSQDAIRQAVEIRTQAQRAAALSANEADFTSPDGASTSIGFGAAPVGASMAAAGEAAPLSSAAGGKPMMVIKKKNKRKEIDEEGEDSKPAAMPSGADKRARYEE